MRQEGEFTIGLGDEITVVNSIQFSRYQLGLTLEMCYNLVGLPADRTPEGEEAKMIALNIEDWFSELTHKEILLSFELAVNGVIEVDTEHYQKVSVKYISKILKAYRKWKEPHLRALEEKASSFNKDYLAEYLESVKREQNAIQALIIDNYRIYLEEGERNYKRCYLRSQNYDEMKAIGLMNWKQEDLPALKERCEIKAKKYINKKRSENDFSSAILNALCPSKEIDEAKIFAIYERFDDWKAEGVTAETVGGKLTRFKDLLPLDYSETITELKKHNEQREAL